MINENIRIYLTKGYYDKSFRNDYVTDKFYILLDKKYAVEILVNHQDDVVSFMLLKLDPDGKIDETEGYYKFNDTGNWKRMFLDEVCDKLQINYDAQLLKKAGSLGQKWNKDFANRLNLEFKAFEIFFKEFKNYSNGFDNL